jgi:hypothetical protein
MWTDVQTYTSAGAILPWTYLPTCGIMDLGTRNTIRHCLLQSILVGFKIMVVWALLGWGVVYRIQILGDGALQLANSSWRCAYRGCLDQFDKTRAGADLCWHVTHLHDAFYSRQHCLVSTFSHCFWVVPAKNLLSPPYYSWERSWVEDVRKTELSQRIWQD